MPSSMTHTYFGLDVYKKLSTNSQEKIKNNLEYFKIFCQGSDPFMFYHFFIGNKAKEISQLQTTMHCSKTKDFFLATIKYIHQNKLNNNSEAMSYLYGHICHYYLDLYTHPFIHYKSGIFKKGDKTTYKYNGLHQEIEYAIDLYLINQNESIKANKFKVYNEIYQVKSLTPVLKDIIKVSIEDIYSLPDSSYYYEKSIWYMYKFFKIANYDPHGLKLKVYKLIDKITPSNTIKIKELSFSNQYPNITNYLNLNNNPWYLPWDNQKIYKNSFIDLYNLALNKATKTIEEVTELLANKNLNYQRLNILFPNLSFSTGLNCNQKVELKYFEF